MQWYYTIGDRQEGPVSDEELARLARDGVFTRLDYVWHEGMGDQWARAYTVPGLFSPLSGTVDAAAMAMGSDGGLCTRPVKKAWQRMWAMLFRPFNVSKWFMLGVSAWLATLGQGGSPINVPGYGGEADRKLREFDPAGMTESARRFLADYGGLTIAIAGLVLFVVLVVGLTLLWVRSRGRFMLLDNVVNDRALVGSPWHRFQRQGGSLFRWSIGLGIVAVLVFSLLAIGTFFGVLWPCLRAHTVVAAMVPAMVVGLVLWMVAFIIYGYIQRFLEDFVVPLMYAHDLSATEAWRRFGMLFRTHAGHFVVYGLFYVVLQLAAGMITLVFAFATCCLGGCLMALPYIGAVVLLPVTVFFRVYSLEYLAQFGAAYEMPAEHQVPAPLS